MITPLYTTSPTVWILATNRSCWMEWAKYWTGDDEGFFFHMNNIQIYVCGCFVLYFDLIMSCWVCLYLWWHGLTITIYFTCPVRQVFSDTTCPNRFWACLNPNLISLSLKVFAVWVAINFCLLPQYHVCLDWSVKVNDQMKKCHAFFNKYCHKERETDEIVCWTNQLSCS